MSAAGSASLAEKLSPHRTPKRPAHLLAARYQTLLTLNNAIIGETTQEGLFRCLAKELGRVVACDRFSISVYDQEEESLTWFAMAEGVTVAQMDLCPRSMEVAPIAKKVITTREPWLIPDMRQYTHLVTVRHMVEAGLTASMAFPLIARGRVVGSLNISFKKNPEDHEHMAEFLGEVSSQVALAVDNMLSHTQLVKMNAGLKQRNDYLLETYSPPTEPIFFHDCAAMQAIMEQLPLIVNVDEPVLITGETGTGKDHLARYIHNMSARRDALFVKVNCPALSPGLFESELFGHVKGAFTGAHNARMGRFAMAEGGTVFLDEIGELPGSMQAKLLHVLQDRRFERVGDSRSIEVNFRIVAATNVDLQEAIREKTFRSDLYYRLNTVHLHLPPLRERMDGLETLTVNMLRRLAEERRKSPPVLSAGALEVMRLHPWPGNLRELRNILNRLLIIHSDKVVKRKDMAALLGVIDRAEPETSAFDPGRMEREHLIRALTMSRGVVGGGKGACRILGLPKSTLQYKLKKHGLRPADYA